MSSSDNDKLSSLPSFSGYNMPLNITEEIDEDVEPDTTRDCHNASFEPIRLIPSCNIYDLKQPNFLAESTADLGKKTKSSISPVQKQKLEDEWKVESAPVLPDYHFLDDDSILVENKSAREVAIRLCHVLKELSIEASYDSVKAKARCVTIDHVDFRIFLYTGKGRFSNGIIVEVQRRDGFSPSFRNEVLAILDAAVGRPVKYSSLGVSKHEDPLQHDSIEDYRESDAFASVKSASHMLKQEVYCSKRLAFEILLASTESSKIGKTTAQLISKVLLDPSNDICDILISTCRKSDDEDSLSPLALSVLANALNAFPGKVPSRHIRALLPILVQYLEDATSSPLMAYIAAKCLEPILRQERFSTSKILSALNVAKTVGELKHNALSNQAKSCMRLINLAH
jgi:hypothetical protein